MREVSSAATGRRLRPSVFGLLTCLLLLNGESCLGLPADTSGGPSAGPVAVPLPRSLDIRGGAAQSQETGDRGCSRPVENCVTLSSNACLDSPLDYAASSFALANLTKEWEVRIELKRWSVLKAAPKCWEKVQPLLCSVLMPRCYQDGQGNHSSKVELASRQLCELTRGPCRIVEELGGWPEYFKCDNRRVFSDRSWTVPCDGGGVDYSINKRTKFRFSKGRCVSPLIATSRPEAYFASFGGCGMRCRDPRFADKDYDSVRRLVGVTGAAGVVVFALAILAHVWSWCEVEGHGIVVTWNWTLLMAYLSWLLLSMGLGQQVIAGEDLVCGDDGTVRTEGGWCYLNFFLLYVGFLSLLMWVGELYLCWKAQVTPEGKNDNSWLTRHVRGSNCNLFALPWLLSLLAAFLCSSTGLVEADPLLGVCFITSKDPTARILAVFLPIALATAVYGLLFVLIALKTCRSYPKAKEGDKASSTVLTSVTFKASLLLATFLALSWGFVASSAVNMNSSSRYHRYLVDFAVCSAKKSANPDDSVAECSLRERDAVSGVNWFLALLALLAAVTLSLQWKEFWGKVKAIRPGRKDGGHAYRGKKHEIVKAGYEQRDALEHNGSISIPLASQKLFDLKTAAARLFGKGNDAEATSEEFDSDFAAAIPRLITRRNAIVHEEAEEIREEFKNPRPLQPADAVSLISNTTGSSLSRFAQSRNNYSVRLHTSEEEDLMDRLGKEKGKRKRRVRKIPGLNKKSSRKRKRSLRIARSDSEATSVGTASNLTLDGTANGAAANRQVSVSEVSSSASSVFENRDGEIKLKTFNHNGTEEVGLQRVMDKLAAMRSSTEASLQIQEKLANNSISVQTSLTDLTAACNTPTRSSMDVGTQYDPPPVHLEPNVVVDNEDKPSSETSSEAALPPPARMAFGATGARPKNYMYRMPIPSHNQARRGGIVDLHDNFGLAATSSQSWIGHQPGQTPPLVDTSSTS